ncbi:MAG: hypothetical protein CL609_19725 [Anaerolineaceae bacterium]|nr:hypothetical protein [Anaerolineaceae bacterium]
MPGIIDPLTFHVDDLPGIWSPVQWEQTKEEQIMELETQAAASLMLSVDIPEAMLRLILNETEIVSTRTPPEGYDETEQGEWDDEIVTFKFKKGIKLETMKRENDHLLAVYNFANNGTWAIEVTPNRVVIEKI